MGAVQCKWTEGVEEGRHFATKQTSTQREKSEPTPNCSLTQRSRTKAATGQ